MNIVKGNKDQRTIIKSSTDGKGNKAEEFIIQAGHQIYELDLKTGNITLAKMEDCKDSKDRDAQKIVEVRDGFHIYLPALNKENAKHKFNKILTLAKK